MALSTVYWEFNQVQSLQVFRKNFLPSTNQATMSFLGDLLLYGPQTRFQNTRVVSMRFQPAASSSLKIAGAFNAVWQFACFSHLQCKWLAVISQLVLIALLLGNQLDFPVPGGQANTACLWLPAQSETYGHGPSHQGSNGET